MCDCGTPTIIEGQPGINGQSILCAYNSLTGIGNTSPVGEDILFECDLDENTLITDGDELELYAYLDYTDNDPVTFRVYLDGTNFYSISISDSDPSKRFFKIKIARISQSSQLWTIEQLGNTSGINSLLTLATTSTTFNLSTSTTFQLTANNSATGANQLVLKKAVLYKNIIQ